MTTPNTQSEALLEAQAALEKLTDCDSVDEFAAHYQIVHSYLSKPPAPEQASGERGITKINPGFRWDANALHHVPQLLIEFTPVPANSPSDAKGWVERDALANLLAATPTAEPAGEAVPKGWKLVPVEPTLEMLDRGHHQIDFDRSSHDTCKLVDESHLGAEGVGSTIEQDMRDCWAAMLAAVPSQPSLTKKEPRFTETYCSQCGAEFGPGDAGFSHCEDHAASPAAPEAAEPEQQAHAGEPEVLTPDDITLISGQVTLARKEDGTDPSFVYAFARALEQRVLQSHREAIAKKDAALQACVEALKSAKSAIKGREHTGFIDAAITQAKEQLK